MAYEALKGQKITTISREIKVLAEVEKIWILYDLDENGTFEYGEIELYLKEMAYPHLDLSDDQLHEIFA